MTALVYKEITISSRDDMLSLTDMWRAGGEPEAKRPAEWLRQEATIAFVECVVASLNMGQDHIKTERGRYGATWAHWQIGLAYAKYLSPAFHMWCNDVVRAHMEGRLAAPSPRSFADFDAEWAAMNLPQKFQALAEFRRLHGEAAARWLAAKGGLPQPPAELIAPPEVARRPAPRPPYGPRLPQEAAHYLRTRRKGDPATIEERDLLWKRQGRNREGLVKVSGMLVDPDRQGWDWDKAAGCWTRDGGRLRLNPGGWVRR